MGRGLKSKPSQYAAEDGGYSDVTFTRAVKRIEQVNEKRNKTQRCWAARRNEETEAGSKKRPTHVGKREQQERSATERIDGPDCWECKNP